MKYLRAFIPILPVIIVTLPTDVFASCTPENMVECEEYAGICCRIQESKCRAADPERAGLDIVPCNNIDAACAAHDQCFRDPNGEGQPLSHQKILVHALLSLFRVYLLALAFTTYSPQVVRVSFQS